MDDLRSLIIGFPKTLYFNLKYFRLRDALKLPVLISHRVLLSEVKGELSICEPISLGMIRIGFGDVGIFDKRRSRSVWKVSGKVTFKGRTRRGHGSKICASGELIFGENFNLTAESQIICNKKIAFGDGCLISWDVLVMDTDFHKIKDKNSLIINADEEVKIGDKVWVGCRSIILKGTHLGNNVVVAANSCVHGPVEGDNQIVGGNPVRIYKNDISWEL